MSFLSGSINEREDALFPEAVTNPGAVVSDCGECDWSQAAPAKAPSTATAAPRRCEPDSGKGLSLLYP